MRSPICFILMIILIAMLFSGCVVSIRAPVEESPETVELKIGDTVMIGDHEVYCKDISIFGTSAIIEIDGIEVLIKDLGVVEMPCGMDDLEMELVTFTHDDGVHIIELVYKAI